MLTLAYGESSQRIECPHRGEAVPSVAVTVSITDESASEVLASTAATMGALSTTVAAAVSAGARQITLAAVTGLSVGETIVLTDAYGRTEVVVTSGFSATSRIVQLVAPLARAYAAADIAKSALIYYDADLSDTDDWPVGAYYQAVFECASWSGARAVMFRVVDLASSNPIELAHMTRWAPQLAQLRDGDDGVDFANERAAAWSLIEGRIRAAGRDAAVWRDSSDAANVGGLLAAGLALMNHGQLELSESLVGIPPGEGGIFARAWGDFAALAGWFDEDQDRAVDRVERRRAVTHHLGRGL
jgi:hypothetical protein